MPLRMNPKTYIKYIKLLLWSYWNITVLVKLLRIMMLFYLELFIFSFHNLKSIIWELEILRPVCIHMTVMYNFLKSIFHSHQKWGWAPEHPAQRHPLCRSFCPDPSHWSPCPGLYMPDRCGSLCSRTRPCLHGVPVPMGMDVTERVTYWPPWGAGASCGLSKMKVGSHGHLRGRVWGKGS